MCKRLKCRVHRNPVYVAPITVTLMMIICTVPTDHPVKFMGVALNSTSFYLSWAPPPPEHHNGIIREYRVNVTEKVTGQVYQFSTLSTELVVTRLHPYFQYDCVVVAVTVDEGPHSSALSIRTNETGKAMYVVSLSQYI